MERQNLPEIKCDEKMMSSSRTDGGNRESLGGGDGETRQRRVRGDTSVRQRFTASLLHL